MAYKRFYIALLILTGITGIFGFVSLDGDPLTKIEQQLKKWAAEQPVEKVYLQFDKPYYAAGEDIWFKTYVVSGSNHQPSTISRIVNIDLIDEHDSIKQSVKLPLEFGTAHGDFALPDTLSQGNYRIRAYTNYMRNAGAGYFFNQPVNILNSIISNKNKAKTVSNVPDGKIDIQFFPESGYLVNGLSSKVAFKAVAPNGLGTDVKGSITDNQGRIVTKFNSTHLGMGEFEITPETGATYQAKVTYADGTEKIIALPKALDKGYVLSITDHDAQNLQAKIVSSANATNGQLTLVAQSAGKLEYTIKNKPGSAVFTALIPKSKFPTGIVQFTLFSSSGEPLNERLVFIRHTNPLKLSIAAEQQAYTPRGHVRLTLNAQNNTNNAAGSFSVSVTDETKVPVDEDAENNIMANLLLTSDLKGHIERPAYYFNHNDEKARADLDVLMLTQGYHRFEWKQLMNNEYPAKQYVAENSLKVSGTVLTTAGKPVVNGLVKLYDLDSIQYSRDAVTDANGRFAFNNLTFDDSVRFIVQARTDKNKKNVDIKLDKIVPAGTSGNKNVPDFSVDINSNLSVYAQNSKALYAAQLKYGLGNHAISLQEVIIRDRKELLKYSSNLNGPGNADQIIQAKDLQYLGCTNITECLEGRLTGIIFRNGIAYSNRDLLRPMQLVVDGIYTDGQFLNTLNYTDIQAIEVLRNIGLTAIYGGRGGSGLLIVTTKHGGDESDDAPEPIYGRGITTYYPKGYYKAREFYSPQYDRPKTNKEVADLRTTIFWKPNILTGKDGKATFQYFNAGSSGTYRVVVEGVDSFGNIGREVYRYKVQ